ncbi:MAG: J domain-containing protein [Nitrospiraceae bacterium]
MLTDRQETTSAPLTWPSGWPRTVAYNRKSAKFRTASTTYRPSFRDPAQHEAYTSKREVSIAEGVKRVLDNLRLFGVPDWQVIISSNLRLKKNGLPVSEQREPEDPGVAVYWTDRRQRKRVIAIDHYIRVADNLAAIAATLDALRAIDRHGGATILERAFTGFTALPSPNDWRHVLNFKDAEPVTLQDLVDRYRLLAKSRHPDSGGTHAAMAQLNSAFSQANEEVRG